MLEEREKEIGGLRFKVRQMPGLKSLRMFTRLTKLAGPAIAEVTRDDRQLAQLLNQDAASLGAAVAVFCQDLDPDEVEAIARELAAHSKVQIEGTDGFVDLVEAIFDDVFGGRIDRLFGWIAFSLQVNYDSFLGAARSLRSPADSATTKP